MKPVEPNQRFQISISTQEEKYTDASGGTYSKFRPLYTIRSIDGSRVMYGEDCYDTETKAYDVAYDALKMAHDSMLVVHPMVKVDIQ